MGEKGCDECDYFVKHDSYDFIGMCQNQDKTITKKEVCPDQKEIDREKLKEILEEKGWIYCLTCDEPIFSLEELEEHKKGRLVEKRFSDEVASKDSPAAD
ncbi:MAG: hypothetical protein KGY76_09420 [Candidatus Thermoplasmatota archaeon]|nr:hypothetical protein [Candidatus Thermoplasmatota archaeon]